MSVESVGLSLPAIFSVTGSPVTTTGTLEGDLITQPANVVFAGPSSGTDDIPEFRALEPSDLPVAATNSLGAVSVGDGLSITGGGELSADAPQIATVGSLGVISVGDRLSITGGGELSADAPQVATVSSLGVISVGDGLSITGGGELSADPPPIATTSSAGVVSVGSGLTVSPAGVLSQSSSYSVGVPALSSFTKVNQGSCVISEVPGASLTVVGTGSAASVWNNFIMYKAAPTSPYRLSAFFSISSSIFPYLGGGLAFYDPSSTKYVEVFVCWNLNNVCNIQVSKWNSPTSFNTTPVTWNWSFTTAGFWLGIRDDGTNVYYEFSADGANYITIYQEAKTSGFLSSYANNALVTNLSNATSARKLNMSVFVWDTNGLARTPTIL